MPYKVNSCFNDFNKNIINLDANQVLKASNSRNALIESIHFLSSNGLIPQSYPEKDIPFGSFARKTKIQPLDDIDLLICFKGCGGTWNYNDEGSISIIMPETAYILNNLCDDGHKLNSRRLIEKIKNELSRIQYYKKAELHRNKEAVTLQLSSYTWNFDIVPCFYATDDFYLIPDGNGNWKKTDPRIDQKKTTEINTLKNGKVLQLIRTMKYWKNIWWSSVPSYMFEQMILNISTSMEFNQSFSRQICTSLNSLSFQILNSVPDPKSMQGNLNTFDKDTKENLSRIALDNYNIANNARIKEITEIYQKEAIELWGTIFGKEFPGYGV